MRTNAVFSISLLLIIACAGAAYANPVQNPCCVTYISSEAIYVDAGISSGINVGDTIAFVHEQQMVALGIVTKAADRAAAAEIAHQTQPVQVGDKVALLASVSMLTSPGSTAAAATAIVEKPASAPKRPQPSRLKGTVSISNFMRMDMTDTELDRYQPGLRTKLSVNNIGGSNLTWRMRHHTRMYHRSKSLYSGQDTNDWVHRIYEFGIFHDVDGSAADWAVGRVLSPYVRGVGYIDGGYLAYRVHPNFRIGLAGGTAPDMVSSEPDFDRRRFGIFGAFETGSTESQKFALTAALSTEYDNSTVSRDFIYLQGTFSHANRLSLYQSVEVDLNRDWRYDQAGERFTLTNYYANANVTLAEGTSVFFSYDARKNVRYIETMDTPDSLFNDDVHKGIRGGFNLRFYQRFNFRVYGGMRFREGLIDDNKYISGSLRINRFPLPRHSVAASLHIVETQFTTGYRPMLQYRFPVSRRIMLNLTGSGYIYKAGSTTTSYYYGEARTTYNFARRYFISGSYRQYFDDELKSVELNTELGIRI